MFFVQKKSAIFMSMFALVICLHSSHTEAEQIVIDEEALFIHDDQEAIQYAFGSAQNITPEQYKKIFEGYNPILGFITDRKKIIIWQQKNEKK